MPPARSSGGDDEETLASLAPMAKRKGGAGAGFTGAAAGADGEEDPQQSGTAANRQSAKIKESDDLPGDKLLLFDEENGLGGGWLKPPGDDVRSAGETRRRHVVARRLHGGVGVEV